MHRRIPATVFLALALLCGCGQGWYVLSDRVASPPPATPREGGYLTGTVDLKNREVLLAPAWQPALAQRVRYLLVSAQFVPGDAPSVEGAGAPEVPVLMLDLRASDAVLEDVHDLDIMSMYPLHGRGPGPGRIAFRIRVLREDAAGVVRKVWSAITAASEVAEIDPSGYLDLSDRLMGVLKPFVADATHTQIASFKVDAVGDEELATAWVLLPTDGDGKILAPVRKRWVAVQPTLAVRRGDAGPRLFEGDEEVDDLPYLIVRYRRDDYRSDPDLLSRKWDRVASPGECPPAADAADWVYRAWAALNRDAWSPQQREVEKSLLRANQWCLNVIAGPPPASGALGPYLQCLENLPPRLPKSHPLHPFVDRAMDNLERCARSRAAQVDGYDAVTALIGEANEVRAARVAGRDPRRLALPDVEAQIRRTSEVLARVASLGVERARWTREVATWRDELTDSLYRREFDRRVERLATARAPDPDLEADVAERLAALADRGVDCARCRDEVRAATRLYGMTLAVAQVPAAERRAAEAGLDDAGRAALVAELRRLRDRVRDLHERRDCDDAAVQDLLDAIARIPAPATPAR